MRGGLIAGRPTQNVEIRYDAEKASVFVHDRNEAYVSVQHELDGLDEGREFGKGGRTSVGFREGGVQIGGLGRGKDATHVIVWSQHDGEGVAIQGAARLRWRHVLANGY